MISGEGRITISKGSGASSSSSAVSFLPTGDKYLRGKKELQVLVLPFPK